MSRRAAPDACFRYALQQRLQEAGYVSPRWRLRLAPWQTGVVSLGLVLSLGAGTATYAYTSDDVLPNHPLYPIRTGIESIEMSLASSPEQKAAVSLKQVQRRMHETQLLQQKKQDLPAEHVEVMMDQLQTLEKTMDQSPVATSTADATALGESDSDLREEVKLVGQEMSDLVEQRNDAPTASQRQEADKLIVEDAAKIDSRLHTLELREQRRQDASQNKSDKAHSVDSALDSDVD